ncbi:MAG TPA: response regulator [Flavisolibacter sp.]|nr:response regulator [Flavisolibacter sp.]
MTKATPPKSIIVYADDDPDDLQLLEQAFTHYSNNIEMVTVSSGFQLLSYLKGLAPFDPLPCLIILDINMPGLNGKEVLLQLRQLERFESIPVVLFTTSSSRQDKEFAGLHNVGFLTKPIDGRQMGIIADQFIDHCSEEVKKNLKDK